MQNLYPGFFEPANPQVLDAILFGGGFGSQDYGAVQEGFQLEQTVTPYIGVVGRVTGYQLWIGDHFNNPLAPATFTHQARLNFARLQGGVELTLYPGTTLFLLGGGDVGDSSAAVIEGDYSSWLFTHTHHPLNFSFSASHDYENHVTSSEIDLRMVAFSTANYLGQPAAAARYTRADKSPVPADKAGRILAFTFASGHLESTFRAVMEPPAASAKSASSSSSIFVESGSLLDRQRQRSELKEVIQASAV